MNSSLWEGRKANFLGDSITFGVNTTKTYHEMVQEMLNFSVCRNYGISGSTISTINTPMYSRALEMDEDSDIVFVFGGTNDFKNNVPMGSLFTIGPDGQRLVATNPITFYGALHQLCKNLISRYSGKQIVLLTPLHREIFNEQPTEFQPNTLGLFLEEYVKAIIEIGKWYSIPVLDLYSISGLQPNEPENKRLYFTPTDGLHPNLEGHKILAKKIVGFLMETLPVT